MTTRSYMLSLIGASVAAGIFPTFHSAFAMDPAEHTSSDLDPAGAVKDHARHREPGLAESSHAPGGLPKTFTHNDIAWRPLAI